VHPALIGALVKLFTSRSHVALDTNNLTPDPPPVFTASRTMTDQGSSLIPEYRSQDGSGTAVYHRFEDRSIILSRTTLIEVYTLSLISVFWAQACAVLYAIISQRRSKPERTTSY